MVQLSQQSDAEHPFAHLLQPIRDLTCNWNIDITSELENYLQEIESIAVTFDHGKTKLNFAEAALIIQGSACVYSKKVDYLYALVYQVLDLLANKKAKQAAANKDGNSDDTDALNKQDDEEFLSLDDISESRVSFLKNRTADDVEAVPSLPKVNLCLIPLTEAEKGENPLLSNNGEVLGSRNDFKINTSYIHPSGTLLLDLSHLNILEQSIANKPSSTPFKQQTATKEAEQIEVCEEAQIVDEIMDDHVEEVDSLLRHDGTVEPEPVDMPGREHRERQANKRTRGNDHLIHLPPKLVSDPWTSLDPHKEYPFEKPFTKKEKTIRMPPSLIVRKKRKHGQQSQNGNKQLVPLLDFFEKVFYSRTDRFPKDPLKVPVNKEFEELYWAEFKRRQARLKKERKMLKHEGQLKDLIEDMIVEDRDDIGQDICGNDETDNDDNDADNGPVNDIFVSDQQKGDDIQHFDDMQMVNSYEELLKQHIEVYMSSAEKYTQMSELAQRVVEWENKILPILEEEEKHGPFDIHKSGSEIISYIEQHATKQSNGKLELPTEKLPFRVLCANKPPYEVCRLFLATLQLANTNNVEISKEGELEKAMDTMSIRLLSTTRLSEQLKHYQVPSAM